MRACAMQAPENRLPFLRDELPATWVRTFPDHRRAERRLTEDLQGSLGTAASVVTALATVASLFR